MCNLYRMTKPVPEVAKWFGTLDATGGANMGDEVYPGYPGLVVADGAPRRMSWGSRCNARARRGSRSSPSPSTAAAPTSWTASSGAAVSQNGAVVIPMTAWAEAEGSKGAMTCTWLNLPHGDLFACAGVWRRSDEWGDVYSLVMTDANEHARAVHARMPVVLAPEAHGEWLGEDAEAARALCRPWPGDLVLTRTNDKWGQRSSAPALSPAEPTLL